MQRKRIPGQRGESSQSQGTSEAGRGRRCRIQGRFVLKRRSDVAMKKTTELPSVSFSFPPYMRDIVPSRARHDTVMS